MLKSLELYDWKSFGPSPPEAPRSIPFAPLTLLVGPNASGKSNVLDALRFLQGIALDLPVEDVLRGRSEGGREVWPGIRGGPAEASRKSTSWFAIDSVWDTVLHSIAVLLEPGAGIAGEALGTGANHFFFNTHADALRGKQGRQQGGALSTSIKGNGKGNRRTRVYRDSASVLGQLQDDEEFAEGVVEQTRAHRQRLRDLLFLDIQPSRMRGPSQVGRFLGLNGENIAAAVHNLSPQLKQDVVDWLSELCATKVTALKTELVANVQEVYLFTEEQSGTNVSARSISDGTLRFLGTLVALLTAAPGSVVLLEEPDVGLHPARIHLLAEFLEMVTKRGIQVIATSHSPVLLSHLSQEAFLNTVAFDRNAEGQTIAHRVGNLEHVDQLEDPDKRARLISTGWLERAA